MGEIKWGRSGVDLDSRTDECPGMDCYNDGFTGRLFGGLLQVYWEDIRHRWLVRGFTKRTTR
jgi:hypothetical protein